MIDTNDRRYPRIVDDPHWDNLRESTSDAVKSRPSTPVREKAENKNQFSYERQGRDTTNEDDLRTRYKFIDYSYKNPSANWADKAKTPSSRY